mmetsp:Transcript_41686/g.95516  ORF Transcript_41686/g.95516 Transcript_41686/m.95516 type:complete len:306 (-) Transcript_41686:116-1033(-)
MPEAPVPSRVQRVQTSDVLRMAEAVHQTVLRLQHQNSRDQDAETSMIAEADLGEWRGTRTHSKPQRKSHSQPVAACAKPSVADTALLCADNQAARERVKKLAQLAALHRERLEQFELHLQRSYDMPYGGDPTSSIPTCSQTRTLICERDSVSSGVAQPVTARRDTLELRALQKRLARIQDEKAQLKQLARTLQAQLSSKVPSTVTSANSVAGKTAEQSDRMGFSRRTPPGGEQSACTAGSEGNLSKPRRRRDFGETSCVAQQAMHTKNDCLSRAPTQAAVVTASVPAACVPAAAARRVRTQIKTT